MVEQLSGWRIWRRQRFLWGVLLLGLGGFSAAFSLLMQSGSQLLSLTPPWVTQERALYTLGAIERNGALATIPLEAIAPLAKQPGVSAITTLAFSNRRLRFEEAPELEGELVFFDEQFNSVLLPAQPLKSDGVYLSHAQAAAWRYQHHPEHQRWVTIPAFKQRVLIAGVLPPSMDRVGPYKPALWLPAKLLPKLSPVQSADGLLARRLVRTMPIAIGIALTQSGFDADVAVNGLAEPGSQNDIRTIMEQKPNRLLPGFTLEPQRRADTQDCY
ncbi:hypothetical protein FCL40_18070 [Ferrimonas sediminicola]|uniref:Uncharacterized protein n=1 Tax=Ferrimonas sediminicola TaxID=2569538 RepID=A0A4U1B736_9GAMM|nr:hypothetical protein [Ferrimonas sediminicola]TKB46247.1 hypothetical protein FCL40_18070 [Ferrimonas sediminicola]